MIWFKLLVMSMMFTIQQNMSTYICIFIYSCMYDLFFSFKCKTFGQQFRRSNGRFTRRVTVECQADKTWSPIDLPCECKLSNGINQKKSFLVYFLKLAVLYQQQINSSIQLRKNSIEIFGVFMYMRLFIN